MTSCASSIGQEAALAALEKVSPDWIEQRRQELKSKRDIAYDLITSIPQVTCPKPKGAFYLLPEIACYFGKTTVNGKTISNADDLCLELLREKQVALVSGDAFGGFVCFVCLFVHNSSFYFYMTYQYFPSHLLFSNMFLFSTTSSGAPSSELNDIKILLTIFLYTLFMVV